MNPDEATLAQWLDDELSGDELAALDAWAENHPDQLQAREANRRWRTMISMAMTASIEPPFPDFFNSRITQAIRSSTPKPTPLKVGEKKSSWTSWLIPMAACVGMILTFWLGTKSAKTAEISVAGAPKAIPVAEMVYVPESGVDADVFGNDQSSAATVIVLNGVQPMSDSLDFSQTTSIPMAGEFESTAALDQPENRSRAVTP